MHENGDENYIKNPLLKPDKVLKRKYQSAIFITCSKTNCLVVVPTGLGKTMIALLLAIHQLTRHPNTKVIFLAPTKPLVQQHLRTFIDKTTIPSEQLVLMTGSIPPSKRTELYATAQILFMTPQVLQNDVIGNHFSLEKVSLIIFDEAHRATGDYSYVFLAKKYFSQSNSPKTMGMTASPGKNREIIQEVMQNLGLNAVEIRTEDDPDVQPYIQNIELTWVDVELPPEMQEIINILDKLLKEILDMLYEQQIINSKDLSKISRKDLLNAGKILDLQISQNSNSQDLPRLLFLKKQHSNAIRISHMTEVIETQGIPTLQAFIKKSSEEIEKGKGGKSLEELINSKEMRKITELTSLFTEKQINHPKLTVLMGLLIDQFRINPNSRILIFCNFRDTIDMILETLNKSELIKAERFFGQQSKGDVKGLSQKKQLEIIQHFREGVFNTLIATSVAEEGLDISECDVVIFYDIVPGEIRAIQRRGRTGRNRSGKVFLLKTKGTREDAYFWIERYREKQMKQILKELQHDLGNSQKQSEIVAPGQKSMMDFLQKQPELQMDNEINQEIKDNIITQKKEIQIKVDEKLEKNEKKTSQSIGDLTLESHSNNITNLEKNNVQNSGNVKLYMLIDSRETASSVIRTLSLQDITIDLQSLETGDYILSERVGIERKTLSDFISSIKDGRLFDELIRLRNQFSVPIFIIEGDLHQTTGVHPSAILGAISSIILNLNIYIYQTKDAMETAEILIALAKKEQQDSDQKHFSIRFKKLPNRLDSQLEYIIAGIPGINIARAKDLLTNFETLQNIFNASAEELLNTPNIGKVLAEKIHQFATSKYKKKEIKNNAIDSKK